MSITREKLKESLEWEGKIRKKASDTQEKYHHLDSQEKDVINNSIISFLKKNKDRVFTQREIAAASDGTKEFPIEPSEILRRQFTKAIEKYDGSKYCQIRQLEYYFKF